MGIYTMTYFAVQFNNNVTFILTDPTKEISLVTLTDILQNAIGFYGHEPGTILNPKQFLAVTLVSNPDDRQKKVARDLDEVLF